MVWKNDCWPFLPLSGLSRSFRRSQLLSPSPRKTVLGQLRYATDALLRLQSSLPNAVWYWYFLFKVAVLEHFSWYFLHFQSQVIQVFIEVPVAWESNIYNWIGTLSVSGGALCLSWSFWVQGGLFTSSWFSLVLISPELDLFVDYLSVSHPLSLWSTMSGLTDSGCWFPKKLIKEKKSPIKELCLKWT